MADEAVSAPASAPEAATEVTAPVDTVSNNVDGEAPITKEDEEIAGKVATTEVNVPTGDATAEAAAGPSAVEEGAETPAAKDKKRKSSSGVPEHKSKKLNKKKSMPTLRLDAKPGEIYWARLKGYPPWPSIIADEQMLPEDMLASRPVSAARPDGSLREDFRDGGKNAKDRTFAIMFLATNEFAWLVNTGLTPLDPSECAKPSTKMTKSLQQAYEVAAEGHDLEYFKQLLQQFQEETQAIEEERAAAQAEAAEKAAAKAAKAEAKARKSKEEGADSEAKPSKKRKKGEESDADAKSKKQPKITKLNAPKEPNGESVKKPAKSKKKVPAPDADGQAGAEMSEEEKFKQREKHMLYLRHRLQKAFLTRDVAPKEDEMPAMNDMFVQLEGHQDLEPSIIRTTKIHKVLKGIVKLDSVPKDEEYNFKKRSSAMLEIWNKRMEADGENAAKSIETPATNGDAKAEENGEAKVEETNETAEEIKPAPVEDTKTETASEAKPVDGADGDVNMEDAHTKVEA